MRDKHDLYEILGSEIRRKILIYIGERGSVRFTDLKNYIGISVGSLYYHLDILEGLVIQTSDKRYTLSEEGREAYKLLTEKNVEIPKKSIVTEILYYVMLSRLIVKLSEKRSLRYPLIVLLFISYLYLTYTAHIVPGGFFSLSLDKYYIFYSLLTWGFVYLFSDVFSSLLFKRWGFGHLLLLELSLLPVSLLYVIVSILTLFSITVNEYIFLIFQSWSLIVLGFIIAYTKGLKTERGLLIALVLLYVNLILIYKYVIFR
jgi:DNA-binding MarR family transcriptional regulator